MTVWTVLGYALPLAAGITLSPVSLIIGLVLLLGERGRTKAAIFGFCWFLSILIVTGIAYNIVGAADRADAPDTHLGIEVLQLGLAGFCLALAAISWRRTPRAGVLAWESRLLRHLDNVNVLGAAALGLAQGFVRAKNIFLAIGAGARFGEAGLTRVEAVVALVVFAVLATTGVLVPLIVATIGGSGAPTSLARAREWLERNMSAITIVVLLVVGGFFLGQGLNVLD